MKIHPIATAPHGKRILLYYPHVKKWVCGSYKTISYYKKPLSYWSNDQERLWGVIVTTENPPTHWTELPPSP